MLLLDLPVAPHLFDDQLRVADELGLSGSELLGERDAEQQRPVLGDVVGRLSDRLAALGEDLPRRIGGDGRDAGRSRVSTRAAVDVDDDPRQALTSSLAPASEITFWARCDGISSCRVNSIV
jgi:hypothetical protein